MDERVRHRILRPSFRWDPDGLGSQALLRPGRIHSTIARQLLHCAGQATLPAPQRINSLRINRQALDASEITLAIIRMSTRFEIIRAREVDLDPVIAVLDA